MELTGLEPRRSDLARGIVIARGARPLDRDEQRELWATLAVAGVTEAPEEAGAEPRETSAGDLARDRDAEDAEDDDKPPRQWLAASWLPPLPSTLDAQRLAFEAVAAQYGLEAIWCVKIETAVDGVVWLEETAMAEPSSDDSDDDPPTGETEVVDAVFDERLEVIYSAPDSPSIPDLVAVQDGDDGDEDDDDPDEDDFEVMEPESHWRGGGPPMEQQVPFPLERYPEILEESQGERFGIALKLTGIQLPGEESVINAFFALWLSVYQDERADEFEPFQRADVVHDRRHRSALMWVERFGVPATPSEQVHFLMWIVARIHEITPIAWARFETVDEAVRSRADTDDDVEPFVLAGNPFADRFRRHGEEGALTWSVGQSAWSKRELAGMVIEVALEHDPDDQATALIAERLLRRALALDPESDATGYLAIVLVRQKRMDEAIALAAAAPSVDVRLLVVGEIAEQAPAALSDALVLLDPPTIAGNEPEELADLVASVARHAPATLPQMLALLPPDSRLIPYLYNSSFTVERPQGLAILRAVLALPAPPKAVSEARTAYVMAWNNACIHAHALDLFELAVELAVGGQPYGPENPYIFHSAACAFAAVGDLDRAIEQVRLAIEHDYEHAEKMETDTDLSRLHSDPRFKALFTEWRDERPDLN